MVATVFLRGTEEIDDVDADDVDSRWKELNKQLQKLESTITTHLSAGRKKAVVLRATVDSGVADAFDGFLSILEKPAMGMEKFFPMVKTVTIGLQGIPKDERLGYVADLDERVQAGQEALIEAVGKILGSASASAPKAQP